ncbi:cyanase [Candidatus Cyanaurora vandensis]|uniref:cyanase n=1 Tax=Candidatus Cyanaurora vandensis TaxID=2714958 RepID=UPI00257AB771|nr:cyanase [Candidatus Cyanaurora vandensis]
MALFEITDILLAAKREKGLTYTQLGAALGHDKVWVAALLYGQARATQDEAEKLLGLLNLDLELAELLTDYPLKGSLDETVPTDPLLYRFFEIMQVYGLPMKAVIQEEFGDGIMSAIDFTLTIAKVEDPKGDRVVVTYDGKFLPYKKW